MFGMTPGLVGGMGAAAAGAAGGGLPWHIILPILGSLLPGIGGGRDEDEAEAFLKEQELDRMMRRQGLGKYSWREKQSQQLSPVVLKALINQMQRMGNWGYPEGMGLDFSFLQEGMGGGAGAPRLATGGGVGGARTITPGMLGR